VKAEDQTKTDVQVGKEFYAKRDCLGVYSKGQKVKVSRIIRGGVRFEDGREVTLETFESVFQDRPIDP
jgi:predicted chitinase